MNIVMRQRMVLTGRVKNWATSHSVLIISCNVYQKAFACKLSKMKLWELEKVVLRGKAIFALFGLFHSGGCDST